MDHKAFLASLPPETTAALTARQDRAGLRHLAGHLGLIAATGAWIALKLPLWPLVLPVHGVFLVFLFTLQHETTHKTPFASEALNEWTGRLAGLVLLLPQEWFRYFHLAHHRHTNDPARDPELLAGAKPETWPAYLWHVSGLPFWISAIRTLLCNAFGDPSAPYLPPRALPRIRRESRWMLVEYTLLALSLTVSPLALWLWIIPVLLGQPVLRLYLLAEHGRCPAVANMFENTRTTFTTRAMRFLSWNMSYHAEHHILPNVPFHLLPDLNRETARHLEVTAPGYVAFSRDYVDHLTWPT